MQNPITAARATLTGTSAQPPTVVGTVRSRTTAAPSRGTVARTRARLAMRPEVEGEQPGQDVARAGSARPRRRPDRTASGSSQIHTAHTIPKSDCTTHT